MLITLIDFKSIHFIYKIYVPIYTALQSNPLRINVNSSSHSAEAKINAEDVISNALAQPTGINANIRKILNAPKPNCLNHLKCVHIIYYKNDFFLLLCVTRFFHSIYQSLTELFQSLHLVP